MADRDSVSDELTLDRAHAFRIQESLTHPSAHSRGLTPDEIDDPLAYVRTRANGAPTAERARYTADSRQKQQ